MLPRSVYDSLTDLNELDAVENARKGRLLGHFKLDAVEIEVSAAIMVDLGQGLQ